MYNTIFRYVGSFFVNSYWATGFELGVELTFPSDESTTSGILTAMSQGTGFLVCWAMGPFNKNFGAFWSMITLTTIFLIGAVLTQLVPNIKRRQEEFQKNINEAKDIVMHKV